MVLSRISPAQTSAAGPVRYRFSIRPSCASASTASSPPSIRTRTFRPLTLPSSVSTVTTAPVPVPQARVKSSTPRSYVFFQHRIRAGQLVEVDVRALRQCWVVPELPAELPERGFVLPGKVRRLHREVRDAGVSKLDVAAPVCPAVHIQRLLQLEGSGRVQPDAVLIVRDAPAGHESRRRLHALDAARVAVLKAVAADAPRAVAAHLAERAVGIVKPHPVVRVSLRPRHEHQTVRADRPAAVAQRRARAGAAASSNGSAMASSRMKSFPAPFILVKCTQRPSRMFLMVLYAGQEGK